MAQNPKNDRMTDRSKNYLYTGKVNEEKSPFNNSSSPYSNIKSRNYPQPPEKKPHCNTFPKWLILAVIGVVILLVVICIFLLTGNREEKQQLLLSSEMISTVTPEDYNTILQITASPTSRPDPTTVPPTASPTRQPDPPTNPPITPVPETAPPESSSPLSILDQNEWYSKELRYYYQQLTENEKQLYDRIYEGIMQFQQQIDRTGFTDLEWEHVRYVLYSDTPELFQWTGGGTNYYQTFGEYTTTYFEPEYRMTQDEYNRICTHIHGIVNDLSKSISSDTDDYKKEWIINAWLVDHCTYLVAGDKSTAYADASLYIGKSQCSGYSRGFMLLLRSFGIECLAVSSDTHEWNIVRINHRWYVADSTWNDTAEADGKPGGNRCFYWVNVPDRLVTDSDHIINPVPGFSIPQCNSLQDNYAVREGVYIVSGTGNVAEQMAIQLKNAHRSGKDSVLVFIDDTAAIANWENIRDRFYHQYDGYGWALYNPKNQMVFAVWDDT